MEKFAVDLDKVLDDFELAEDQRAQSNSKANWSPLVATQVFPLKPAAIDTNFRNESASNKSTHRAQFLALAERNLKASEPESRSLNDHVDLQDKDPDLSHTPQDDFDEQSENVQVEEQVNDSASMKTQNMIKKSLINGAAESKLDSLEKESLLSFSEDISTPQNPITPVQNGSDGKMSASQSDLFDLEPWDAHHTAPCQVPIVSPNPIKTFLHKEGVLEAPNCPGEEELISLPKAAVNFDSLPEVTDDELNSYLESLNELEDITAIEATPVALPVLPEPLPIETSAILASLDEPSDVSQIEKNEGKDSKEEEEVEQASLQQELQQTDDNFLETEPSQDQSCSETESSEGHPVQDDLVQESADPEELAHSSLEAESVLCIDEVSELENGGDLVPDCSESSSSSEPSPEPGSEGSLKSEQAELPSDALASPEPYSSLSEEERMLGLLKPFWIPDEDALVCMQCNTKFNVIKRRHHCRACGKVLCSLCCNMKAPLEYLEKKEGRVCQPCLLVLNKVEAYKRYANNQLQPNLESPTSSEEASIPLAPESQQQMESAAMRRSVNPNNPAEYCSTISPWQQMAGAVSRPPPAVYVPVGVLKKEGSTRGREPKNVIFSDGIRPGRDLTDMEGWGTPHLNSPVRQIRSTEPLNGLNSDTSQLLFVEAEVPPVLIPSIQALSLSSGSPLSSEALTTILRDPDVPAVIFVPLKNLFVSVKLVQLDCCVKKWCWCFSSEGLRLVGQDEVLLAIEQEDGEILPPKDIFQFYKTLFEEAAQGQVVTELGHYLIPGPFLGSSDLGGFVFVRASFQCLQKLPIPQPPYLVGLLIQRWETPWAKVFPLRLVLRLGAEFRYYPCPLVSVRRRSPVFAEVGHTIINLLADMRNFTYCLPTIPGLRVHMENKQTNVLIPRNRYDKVCRALGQSNDHVLSFGASFSPEADSHLVCMQQEDGSYQTQAINIHSKPRSVTGASFIVFNGALKSASGLTATSTIVEDGIMLQLLPDTLVALRQALLNMKDFMIPCGRVAAEVEETVNIQWGADDKNVNAEVTSPIDGRSLAGVMSVRVPRSKEHKGEGKLALKWTEVFLIQTEDSGDSQRRPRRPGTSGVETVDAMRLAENLARASCQALIPHLRSLAAFRVLAIRVTLDVDTVEYEAGTAGQRLPPSCMGHLDSALIPALHKEASSAASSSGLDGRIVIEVWLRICHQ